MPGPKIAVLLLLIALSADSAAQPLPQAKIDFVQGFGAGSFIPNADYQKARLRNFKTGKVGFYPRHVDNPSWPLLTRSRTLECIARADVFVFSGHSGPLPAGMHVLQVADAAGKGRDNINAGHIAAALKGRAGSRLVVVNGCRTTDPSDGIPETRRMATGFGIRSGTKGRAYLGWSTTVWATTGENWIGRLFNHWTTMRADGTFPTLDESRGAVGTPRNLVLIGDGGLRYKTAFDLRADNDPKVRLTAPLRLFLDATGPSTARAAIDFGAANEALLKRLGAGRFMEMDGAWKDGRYAFSDAPFRRVVQRLFAALASESKDATVKVHEAAWSARPDGSKVRVTVRLHVEIAQPKHKPSILKNEYRLVGVPEVPSPKK